jgi:hypothetical protein
LSEALVGRHLGEPNCANLVWTDLESKATWLIQVGTISKCESGLVSYQAVWDIVRGEVGLQPVPFENFIVEPNDHISAKVRYEASTNDFYVEIVKHSKGKSASLHDAIPGTTAQNSRSYALCIVESQGEYDVLGLKRGGLAKFTTPIEFTPCAYAVATPGPNNLQLYQFNIDRDKNGNNIEPKAEVHPRDISGAFTVEWQGW